MSVCARSSSADVSSCVLSPSTTRSQSLQPRRVLSTPITGVAGAGRIAPFCKRSRSRSQKDPRTLDKPFCQRVIKQLRSLLDELGCEIPMNPKKFLTDPTSKEFVQICQFLYSRIDAIGAAKWGKKNGEDVADLAKELQYPIPLAKSALKAVGTPSTWPQLVGLLDWLSNLLIFAQGNQFRSREVIENFNGTISIYSPFMEGADEYVDKRVQERTRVLGEELEQDEERLEALRNQTEKWWKKKCQPLNMKMSLPEMEEKLEDLKQEIPKLQMYCERQRQYLKHQRDAETKLNSTIALLKVQDERKQRDRDARYQQIAQQPFTVEEENEMLKRFDEMDDRIKTLRAQETRRRNSVQKLEGAVIAVNKEQAQLKIEKDNVQGNGARLHDVCDQMKCDIAEVNEQIDAQDTRIAELTRLLEDDFAEEALITKLLDDTKEEVSTMNEQYMQYASAPCFPLLEELSDGPISYSIRQNEEIEEDRNQLLRELRAAEIHNEDVAKRQREERALQNLDSIRQEKLYFERLLLRHW